MSEKSEELKFEAIEIYDGIYIGELVKKLEKISDRLGTDSQLFVVKNSPKDLLLMTESK